MILRRTRSTCSSKPIAVLAQLPISLSLSIVLCLLSASSPCLAADHGQQVHFAASPVQQAASNDDGQDKLRSFSLVQGVHFGTHAYPGLAVQRSFDPTTYPAVQVASAEQGERIYELADLPIRSKRGRVWRPSHPARSQVYEDARRGRSPPHSGVDAQETLSWEQVEVDVPDVQDVGTLSALAKMSSNAYITPKDGGWFDLDNTTFGENHKDWNLSSSFGWQEDGLRGHVFSSGPSNESIIIAIKGTSAFSGGIGGPTGRNDKLNDNLLFSCCCARVDWTWSPVCDCYNGTDSGSGNQRCNLTCLEDALIEKSVYYPAATDLFNNLTLMYPTSNIWLTGHSLGGSLASLLAITFGVPCVTFEAPGDLQAARRLHLPLPPGTDWSGNRPEFGVTHVYTNSDPIPQGVVSYSFASYDPHDASYLQSALQPQCTGALSTCGLVGFALETKCHTGQSIIYDAVGKLGWGVDIRTHRVGVLIDRLLIEDWDKSEAAISDVALLTEKHTTIAESRKVGTWWWPWPRKGKHGEPSDDDGNDDTPQPPRNDSSEDDGGEKKGKKKTHVPAPTIDKECVDCFKWEFFDDFEGSGSLRSTLDLFPAVKGKSRRRDSGLGHSAGCAT